MQFTLSIQIKPLLLIASSVVLMAFQHDHCTAFSWTLQSQMKTLNLASSSTNLEERDYHTHEWDVYLRFSPLVNGPTFLPLHVEIILLPQHLVNNYLQSHNYKNYDNTYAPSTKQPFTLHRFDFLPNNPTDPSTTSKLLTFRFVSGNVRYRCQAYTSKIIPEDVLMMKQKREDILHNVFQGKTAFFIGSKSLSLDSIMRHYDEFSKSRTKLHLVLNNCYTFVFLFLKHLESEEKKGIFPIEGE